MKITIRTKTGQTMTAYNVSRLTFEAEDDDLLHTTPFEDGSTMIMVEPKELTENYKLQEHEKI